ncbi:MAG: peptide MFS transporter [Polyangiaceae bacterium]|nr:peptide MFS transporter [Polyangiaceae bacterium]
MLGSLSSAEATMTTNQNAVPNEEPLAEREQADGGHPQGLYTLFGTEAWERFSYYGMRALLVLYLVNRIKLDREHALEIYGIYTSLVYLTPLVGGYLADKILGRRKAVLIGGIVMALGQIALMFQPLLHLALGLLIAGNGFFKPNISTMVGGLYRQGDTRRDGAFTIFYMGINLGAFWSPLICGTLGERVAFPLGFGTAALGMAFGLTQFVHGQKNLGITGLPPGRAATMQDASGGPSRSSELKPGRASLLGVRDYVDIFIWAASTCALVGGLLFAWNFMGPYLGAVPWLKVVALAVALCAVLFQLFRGSNAEEAQQVGVILVLCLFNIFFWMGFEQAGGTMTLFADEQTERNVGGTGMFLIAAFVFACAYNFRRSTKDEASGKILWLLLTGMFVLFGFLAVGFGTYNFVTGTVTNIPASMFQSINPLIIVALAPTFSKMWDRLDSGKYRTSTPTKMALGMVILGLGFLVLFAGQKIAVETGTKASAAWLGAVYVIHTTGELCLSPIGLSMVTKLAPPRVSSLAMGLWLGSSAVANYFAGTLESMLTRVHVPIYGFLVVSSIGPALLLISLTPLLKRWMRGKA